jgi:hypothetical protein
VTDDMKRVPLANNDAALRLSTIVDERLLGSYWESVQALGTQDLVLFFDESVTEGSPVWAHTRDKMLKDPECPAWIKGKLDHVPKMKDAKTVDAAFWLVVLHRDGTVLTTAVGAKLLSPPGEA